MVKDKIVFTGFFQRSEKYEDMPEPKPAYENLPRSYIMTDDKLNIIGVSEDLFHETGLSCKFFKS